MQIWRNLAEYDRLSRNDDRWRRDQVQNRKDDWKPYAEVRCNKCPGYEGADPNYEADYDCVFGMEVADCLVAECAADDCCCCGGLMKLGSYIPNDQRLGDILESSRLKE